MHTNSKDIIKKEVPREGTWYQSGLDKGYVGHKAAKAMKRANHEKKLGLGSRHIIDIVL